MISDKINGSLDHKQSVAVCLRENVVNKKYFIEIGYWQGFYCYGFLLK